MIFVVASVDDNRTSVQQNNAKKAESKEASPKHDDSQISKKKLSELSPKEKRALMDLLKLIFKASLGRRLIRSFVFSDNYKDPVTHKVLGEGGIVFGVRVLDRDLGAGKEREKNLADIKTKLEDGLEKFALHWDIKGGKNGDIPSVESLFVTKASILTVPQKSPTTFILIHPKEIGIDVKKRIELNAPENDHKKPEENHSNSDIQSI